MSPCFPGGLPFIPKEHCILSGLTQVWPRSTYCQLNPNRNTTLCTIAPPSKCLCNHNIKRIMALSILTHYFDNEDYKSLQL